MEIIRSIKNDRKNLGIMKRNDLQYSKLSQKILKSNIFYDNRCENSNQ